MSESKIPEDFDEKYPDSVVKERFTRIWDKIEEMWGTQEGIDYLDELVVIDDGKDRQGFDLNVMSELLFLAQCHRIFRLLAPSGAQSVLTWGVVAPLKGAG